MMPWCGAGRCRRGCCGNGCCDFGFWILDCGVGVLCWSIVPGRCQRIRERIQRMGVGVEAGKREGVEPRKHERREKHERVEPRKHERREKHETNGTKAGGFVP